MGITVQNVTDSTALVIWPLIYGCTDSFYSLMYHPNWNSMLSAHSRKDFQKEERVPGRRTSFTIENLTPLTTYILCVTCQSKNPTSDQCQVFNTLAQDTASANSKKKELALGIWLTSSILLLIIACILVYGCLHIWWRKRRQNSEEPNASPERDKEMWMKNTEDTLHSRDNRNQPPPNNEQNNVEPTHLDITENTLTNAECGTLNSDNQERVQTPEEAVSEL